MEPENQPAPEAPVEAAPVDVQPLALAIGESVSLAEDKVEEVLKAEQAILKAHTMLGTRREQFLLEEAQLMNAVQSARRTYEATVKAAGNALGLVFEGDVVYTYDAAKRTFTRSK